MSAARVELGLRENAAQFGLLIGINALVGAMVGLERSTLPLIGEQQFGVGSSAAVLSFIVAFGAAKALTNLGAGALADRIGRRRLLIAGWALALPVPLLVGLAPAWSWIVVANVFLGVNQGLAWSMTVVMKIDLVGPRNRGLALGLNEAAGYGGVALAAALSGWLAASFVARDVLVVGGVAVALAGLLMAVLFVRDTASHVALEQAGEGSQGSEQVPRLRDAFRDSSYRVPALRACSQAGLVNNLNDALAWGLVPLFLAADGASVGQIGLIAGLYPAVWGLGQIWTGHWSDQVGRRPLIVAGMFLQGGALALLAASGGAVSTAAVAAVLLGVGTAMVYPTLLASISDTVSPITRAGAVGVYRFWRDTGYVVGGIAAGVLADAVGFTATIASVGAVTILSGVWVAIDLPAGRRLDSGSRSRQAWTDGGTLSVVSRSQTAGAVAPANDEAVRAWDTVLYERWKTNRKIFVGALDAVTDEVLDRAPPPVGGRCIDIGCGFGNDTRRLAQMVGPEGSALGTDSSPSFIEDARAEAAEAGVENVGFEVADAQTASWDPIYDYAFSRMGTQFFAAPVPAMRAIRGALKPGGELHKICWRRKAESQFWAETEQVVARFLSRPEEYDADTCGPGPFSLGNPDTTRGILEAAGFERVELRKRDFDYYMGEEIDEAVDALLAIGPGAELIRLNGEHGEERRPEIAAALADHYAAWERPDGSVVGRGSVWIVSAVNPG